MADLLLLFFTSLFNLIFLNFTFLIPHFQPPKAQPHPSRGAARLTPLLGTCQPALLRSAGTVEPGTAGKWCLSISSGVTYELNLFSHPTSCLLGAQPVQGIFGLPFLLLGWASSSQSWESWGLRGK